MNELTIIEKALEHAYRVGAFADSGLRGASELFTALRIIEAALAGAQPAQPCPECDERREHQKEQA